MRRLHLPKCIWRRKGKARKKKSFSVLIMTAHKMVKRKHAFHVLHEFIICLFSSKISTRKIGFGASLMFSHSAFVLLLSIVALSHNEFFVECVSTLSPTIINFSRSIFGRWWKMRNATHNEFNTFFHFFFKFYLKKLTTKCTKTL